MSRVYIWFRNIAYGKPLNIGVSAPNTRTDTIVHKIKNKKYKIVCIFTYAFKEVQDYKYKPFSAGIAHTFDFPFWFAYHRTPRRQKGANLPAMRNG